MKANDFHSYQVMDPICQALAAHGITSPFPIQARTLPIALKGQDVIGQAKTGTGKTLGFAIPLLQKIAETPAPTPSSHPLAAVILPTRELAKQVAIEMRQAAQNLEISVAEIYGGVAFGPQIKQLRSGCQVVVGTPGRLIDLVQQRKLSFSRLQTVVLDEADEMLDLGFFEDVKTLLAKMPAQRQTMLFSATMPPEVIALARQYLNHPTHIHAEAGQADSGATVKTTRQLIYRAHALNKDEVIARILQAKQRGLTIIFTQTKRKAAQLHRELSRRGFATAALHGDLGQAAREQALRAFRKQKVDVLVATDVAARGIDVDDVTHVINYECPEDNKTYIHRIGRTGRAGLSGTAITFVDWDDVLRWRMIDRSLQLNLGEPLETYHTSKHLYTDLDIPPEASGRLPRSQRSRSGLDSEKIEDVETRPKRKRAPRPRNKRRRRRVHRCRQQES